MISKATIKFINSLRVKKYRNEIGQFIAEGERLIVEILGSSLTIKTIYHTIDWDSKIKGLKLETTEVTADEMKKISGLTSPSNVLALVAIPEYDITKMDFSDSISLALDGVQDPGNLGTIIRLADWFGIDNILCSNDTVDSFSPKVIQSCMGAISRVKVIYCNLPDTLKKIQDQQNFNIYGTFMKGVSIYSAKLASKGIIVMGNEGNGVSLEIERLVSHKIHIPNFANNRSSIESLNVAIATAIVCSEFKRRVN